MMNLLLATTTTATVAVHLIECLLVADFATGALHWAEDTWLAPGRNALIDRYIVAPNIEHHERPGLIREGTYWQTNSVCIVIAAALASICIAFGVHAWEAYLTLFIGSQSNQLHAWSHTGNPPAIVGWLQRIGLLQSAKIHAAHHKRPYGVRYCTTTNMLNPVLDRSGFWRAAERCIETLGATVQRATPARNGY